MSADNWAICPKCNEIKNKEKDKLTEKAEDSYGKVPKEEFFRLRKKADSYIVPDCETFREDYEIGIDEDGRLYISYKGKCTKCGFKKDFQYKEQ